jgi:hypothetical protein
MPMCCCSLAAMLKHPRLTPHRGRLDAVAVVAYRAFVWPAASYTKHNNKRKCGSRGPAGKLARSPLLLLLARL